VDADLANTEFIAWFMRSPVYLERAPIDTTPGQLPRIRTEEVASVEINLPPPKEQNHIADDINAHMSAIEQMRGDLREQQEAINKMPAALLRQAFNGEL
jgi:type I restriction enzyme S subunit